MKKIDTIISTYKCEHCGKIYDSEPEALACERAHEALKATLSKAKVGDFVFLNNPRQPGPYLVESLQPRGAWMLESIMVRSPAPTGDNFERAFVKGSSLEVNVSDITRIVPKDVAESLVTESHYLLDAIKSDTLLHVPNAVIHFRPTDKDTFVEIIVKVPLPDDKA